MDAAPTSHLTVDNSMDAAPTNHLTVDNSMDAAPTDHLTMDNSMDAATRRMTRVTDLLMKFKQAELMLEEAQDLVDGFRCREMWDEYGVAMDAADEAFEAMESAENAITLELKNNNFGIQFTDVDDHDDQSNDDLLHTDCA